MAKASKPSVHYRDASSPSKRCGKCAHMLSNGGCEIVTGKVEPDYVCDEFTPEAVKTSGPALAKVLKLAMADDYDEALARDRIASRIPFEPASARAGMQGGRTRDYERTVRGREEHVSGHISTSLRAHMLAQHPGIYPYLQEGRDLEALDELHHTDHERHTHGHEYLPPDALEQPEDHIIGDVSKADVDEETGRVRDPRAEIVRHLASVHHSPEGERASMGTPALQRLDQQYHEGHVFRPGERGS